jgi:hypothetical protein
MGPLTKAGGLGLFFKAASGDNREDGDNLFQKIAGQSTTRRELALEPFTVGFGTLSLISESVTPG